MQLGNVAFYFLGAFTFWPLVGFAITYWLPSASRRVPPRGLPKADLPEKTRTQSYLAAQNDDANGTSTSLEDRVDAVSDIEASGWIRVAAEPISTDNASESSAEIDQTETFAKSARKSLRKLVGNSNLFGPSRVRSDSSLDRTDDSTLSSTLSTPTASSTASIYSVESLIDASESRPKTLAKCPRFWAVVRGGQLQLFKNEKERKVVNIVSLPKHVVMLWPQKLPEYELFYKRHPIVLINVISEDGLVQLNLTPDSPPKDALYIYTENPSNKEDLYFALIKESTNTTNLKESEVQELQLTSLGPRDPSVMARPIRSRKAEVQKLQSLIWSSEQSNDSQWLNALLGRLFLATKDSPWAEEYLRHKFSSKLAPISRSSNIIGDIQVRSIFSGDSAPVLSDIKLLELTPEGSLRLEAHVNYSGRFRVNLGTSVRLAAVTSLTTAEIPVELAATVKTLNGVLELRIKPPPSERIWYAFQSMPHVDLEIEPVVYDKQISFAVVTKFIRGKILDSLKETLVLPMMDDLAFYSTEKNFFRGGIWESPNVAAASPALASGTADLSASTGASEYASMNRPPSLRRESSGHSSRLGSDSISLLSSSAVTVVPISNTKSDVPDITPPKSAFRSLGDWVTRKRSTSSLRSPSVLTEDVTSSQPVPTLPKSRPPSVKESVAVSPLAKSAHRRNLSDESVASLTFSRPPTTTTQVSTETAAPTMPLIAPSSPSRGSIRRKPVPVTSSSRHGSPTSLRRHYNPNSEDLKSTDGKMDSSLSTDKHDSNSKSEIIPIPKAVDSQEPVNTKPQEAPTEDTMRPARSSYASSVASAEISANSGFSHQGSPSISLDLPTIGPASPSANVSLPPTTATLVTNHTPTFNRQRRTSSISSLHSLIAPSEAGSIGSGHSSRRRSPRARNNGPKLPPRRRTIQLQNVAPEEAHN